MSQDPIAKIELFVAEKAVARHEEEIQRWIESVAAPLRYVCVPDDGDHARTLGVGLGNCLADFGANQKDRQPAPVRRKMSAFSGFSMARDQRGVWFREGYGATEEDRVTIYTFIVPEELGGVAYCAIRERVARRILRDRNEQAVLMTKSVRGRSTSELVDS